MLPADTFYWYPQGGWHNATAEVSHVVALWADPGQHQLLIAIEYFNTITISVGVRFPFGGTEALIRSHAVDVLAGTEIPALVNESNLRSTAWKTTHVHGEDATFDVIRPRLSRLIGIAQARGEQAEISRIVDSVLGETDGRPVTRDDTRSLAEGFTKFLLSRMK